MSGNAAIFSLIVAVVGAPAMATPLQSAFVEGGGFGFGSDTSTVPLTPATRTRSVDGPAGSGILTSTASFGQSSASAFFDTSTTPGSNGFVARTGADWRDVLNLTTSQASAGYIFVNVPIVADISIDSPTILPLVAPLEMEFLGVLQACNSVFSSCSTEGLRYRLRTEASTFNAPTVRTALTLNNATTFSEASGLSGSVADNFLVRLSFTSGAAFGVAGSAVCGGNIGEGAVGMCNAINGLSWGGVAGVTDLDGNAIFDWSLTSQSGLNYAEAFPLNLGVGMGPGDPAGAVPEPASWAMLIAGFGLVGATARRRRHQRQRGGIARAIA